MNDEALARLMVTEMASREKEERLAFLEIKRREVECREREVRNQEYRQCQDDIRFYLHPYNHLTGDARLAMEELRAKIKAKLSFENCLSIMFTEKSFDVVLDKAGLDALMEPQHGPAAGKLCKWGLLESI
ncbi:hypothetical protein Tco_1431300 [Tanacetum coccineum]